MDEVTEVVEATEEVAEPTVDEKIETAVKKATERLEKKLAAAQKESERLSKLSEDEKRAAELESMKAELESKARELKVKEIELETSKVLDSRNIPLSFMPYFLTDDNETTLNRIKTFEKLYKAEVEKAVNEKLKGKTPPAASAPTVSSSPVQDLQKLIRQAQLRRI